MAKFEAPIKVSLLLQSYDVNPTLNEFFLAF